tara:strand:+ start:193 stop:927 length:735 start_codon:yes stop_codon:yes gene_type:complete
METTQLDHTIDILTHLRQKKIELEKALQETNNEIERFFSNKKVVAVPQDTEKDKVRRGYPVRNYTDEPLIRRIVRLLCSRNNRPISSLSLFNLALKDGWKSMARDPLASFRCSLTAYSQRYLEKADGRWKLKTKIYQEAKETKKIKITNDSRGVPNFYDLRNRITQILFKGNNKPLRVSEIVPLLQNDGLQRLRCQDIKDPIYKAVRKYPDFIRDTTPGACNRWKLNSIIFAKMKKTNSPEDQE